MRITKMKSIVALVAIFITITIMITVYRLTDKTDVVPKSATLVQIMTFGSYTNG